MQVTLKKKLNKVALGLVILAVGAVGLDIAQHYAILKFTTNWLHSTGKRQNTFTTKLNYLTLGGASVDILDLVSTENQETVTIQKITLRKGLFNFNNVDLTAEKVACSVASAEKMTALVQRTTDAGGGITFHFNPVVVSQLDLTVPLLSGAAETILAEGTYTESTHTLALNMSVPKIKVNQVDSPGLELNGNVTVHRPHNGEVALKVKRIEEFSQVLVQAGYLDKTKAQILAFGGQFLGDEDGNINLKVHIKNNDIYLGPFRLTKNN